MAYFEGGAVGCFVADPLSVAVGIGAFLVVVPFFCPSVILYVITDLEEK